MKKSYLYISIALSLIGILVSSTAYASIAFVSTSTNVTPSGAATTVTSTINITTPNLLTVACEHGSTFVPPTSVTDTLHNTFALYGNASNTATGNMSTFWAISSGTNANDILTCNFASSVNFRSMFAASYSGVATTTPLDATSSRGFATPTTATTSSAPFTTTNANDVIVSFANAEAGNMTSVASPFTMRSVTASKSLAEGDNIVSSIQTTQSSTWTDGGASDWMLTIGAFKAAATGSSTPATPRRRSVVINGN